MKVHASPKRDVKDVGLDPILDESRSLSNWAMEFKMLQNEIFQLWHDCNVSLVHRTYFFMLFQGDPSDAIYLEVEIRRMKFLKNKFSHGEKTIVNGQSLTLASRYVTLSCPLFSYGDFSRVLINHVSCTVHLVHVRLCRLYICTEWYIIYIRCKRLS